jgi:serine/threonine-protein kinase
VDAGRRAASASPPAASGPRSRLAPGALVGGRFEVAHVVGEGVTGVVYLARDTRQDGARVALKVVHRHLHGDRQIFQRFHREARILQRLAGAHIVRFLDFLEEDGSIVLVLEHVEGTTLEDRLAAGPPLAIAEAVEITRQICDALEGAHAASVVHRNLKPANVMIERTDGPPPSLRVRVLDFGLAKVVHGEAMSTGLTEQDMVFGTPEYMAPEQVRGDELDGRADVYAAGVMLYELVVGRPPFVGRMPIATMTAHLVEAPRPPREAIPERRVPPALEAVILRALAKSPADRFPSARALADALLATCAPPRVVPPPPDSGEAPPSFDTDLALGRTELANPAPAPSDAAPPSPTRVEAAPLTLAEGPAGRAWMWPVVAALAATLAVVLGLLFGAR